MITKSKIFEVYKDGKNLFTKNLVPKYTSYTEKLINLSGVEYRSWDPTKSKLAACILNGATNIGIRKDAGVLYLGCSTGTTASHISDMIGKNGILFGLDSAPRVLREFIFLCEKRTNMTALLEDAFHPENYHNKICAVDIIYQDIAQRNQAEIFLINCKTFLKKGCFGLLAIKSRSIDVTKKPKQIYREIRTKLEQDLEIIDFRTLDPYEKDHCMFIVKNK